MLAIFLFSLSGVFASEIDVPVANEDTGQLEASVNGESIEVNLQTDEENPTLVVDENDETLSSEIDSEILTADQLTYSDLREQIGSGGNINLTKGTYTYNDDDDTIEISTSGVINGNGAVIDMAQSGHRAFYVTTSDVTIKNLTIKNANYGGAGGAIYFSSSGAVSDCNFTNNKATTYAGAVYFSFNGVVSDCTFTENSAYHGGAVLMYSGSVVNCNFTYNSASYSGGAIYMTSGSVENCNFADNTANQQGGAIFSQGSITADTCIFKTSSDTTSINTVIRSPTLNVDNFTTFYGSGEKLTFDLRTNLSSIPITNRNIAIRVYSKDKGILVGNYNCLSGEGWIPNLPVGYYYAIFDTEYPEFQPINRTLTVAAPEHTFWFLDYTIKGNDNPMIELSHDYYFDSDYDAAFVNGIVINRQVTIRGNGSTIDAKGQARIFNVQAEDTIIENLTLKNAHASDGGAIYFNGNGNVINCNFKDNIATSSGGAVVFMGKGILTNCNFNNNVGKSGSGGAIYFINGTVSDCNFTNNKACYGGAVYFYINGSVTDCCFTKNQAVGNSGYGGAVHFEKRSSGIAVNCNFTNNSANYGGAVFVDGSNLTIIKSVLLNNFAIYGGGAVYVNDGILSVINSTFMDNRVNECGGAIYIYDGGLEIFNSTLSSNFARKEGGAIYSNRNKLSIYNSTLDNNIANGGYGGAVHNGQGALTITGSRIRNNAAEDYVAVCTGNSENVVFRNNEIFNNYVKGFPVDDSNTFIVPPRFGLMPVFDSSLRIRVFEREGKRFNGDVTLTIGGEDFVVHVVNGTGKTDVITSIMASGDYYADITFIGNDEYSAVDYEDVGFSLSINSFANLYALFIEGMIDHNDVILNRDYIYDDDDDFDFIDEYYDLLDENELIIDGKGHTIDCDYEANFLNINSGAKTTVKNLIIINGNGYDHGGAISNEGNLTVINSTFCNNTAYGDGGAIYSYHGYVTIIGSIFSLNNANAGGAIVNDKSYLTVINSTFTGNRANRGGAILNFDGNAVMDNAIFINNSARYGGAISILSGDFSITASKFNNNSADHCGGAIDVSEFNEIMGSANPSKNLFILNAQANNNEYLHAESKSNALVLIVNDSIFDSNTAREIGGAIRIGNGNAIAIDKSLFNKNNANMGGSIHNRGVLTVLDSNLTNNFVFVDFVPLGGAIFSSGDVTMHNANFVNNSAYENGESYGGAIYILSGNFEITESTFINNSAFSGGAIYVDVDNTVPTAPNPLANDVLGSSQDESILGALIPNDSFLKVTGSTFKGNHAYGEGGAIFNVGVVSLTGSRFENNMANEGGAIYSTHLLTMTDSILRNNLANKSSNAYGGAIYNDKEGILRIIACDLSYNTVNGRSAFGGAIYNVGETHVRDSTLTFNRAIGTDFATAGAIYNQNKLYVINTTFANNTATATSVAEGGAILSAMGGLMVDNSTFSGNVASGNQSAGGAIVNLYANATIKNTTFQSNGANNGSAVISANHEGMPPANVNIEDSKFIDNSIEGVVLDDSNEVMTTPEFEIYVPDAVSGESVEITVNEIKMGNKFNGTVTVIIGSVDYSVKVVEGQGNTTISLEMDSGSYTATLIYPGDLNYREVTIESNSFVVSPAKPNVIIPSLDGLSSNGAFTILLSDDAGGNVTLNINGKDYVFDVAGGKVNVKLPELADGDYDYVISYSGDGKYSSFTSTGSLKVNNPSKPVNPVKPVVPVKPVKTTLKLKKVTVKRSAKKLTIQATLKVNGKAIKGKIIKFKFNKKTYKAKTNAKGVAKITVKKSVLKKLKKGTKVTYTATYGKVTKKVKVKVKK